MLFQLVFLMTFEKQFDTFCKDQVIINMYYPCLHGLQPI